MSVLRLSEQEIDRALDRVEPGLRKYLWIMGRVRGCDVRTDATFQRTFNGFYRVRKNAVWRAAFYELMETAKTRPLGFADVLGSLRASVGSVEASFASKLVATLDPERPVWDQFVLTNLGLRKPYAYQRDQFDRTLRVYEELQRRHAELVRSPVGRLICERFVARHPGAVLTDAKRVDLVLWQHRA